MDSRGMSRPDLRVVWVAWSFANSWQGRHHDAAIRVVRRPTEPQSASLLGRRGLDQSRLAKSLADRGAVNDWHAVWRHPGLSASAVPRLAGRPRRPHCPTRLRHTPAGSGTTWRPVVGVRAGPGPLGQQQLGWQPHRATTPDGAVLSGWWLRVGARVLDGIITFVLALPFTGWFYYRYFDGALKWVNDLAAQSNSGSAPVVAFPPWSIYQYGAAAVVIQLLIAGVYEVFFLSRSGATPGKKIVGISVRLRDQAGPPPMNTVLVRTGCYFGLQLINIAYLLDVLWPLWDDKKQAIHDKVAATNVVIGPQPKRHG